VWDNKGKKIIKKKLAYDAAIKELIFKLISGVSACFEVKGLNLRKI
jgi:hypothetical protein